MQKTITTYISTYQHNGTTLVLTIYTCLSLSFLTTKILSFSEVSKYRAFDNKVVFIFNYVTCSTLSIFTWNTGWALPPTGFNKKVMRREY